MRYLFAAALTALGFCPAALADMTHDEALEAVKSGKIMPALSIIEKVEEKYDGQVIEMELDKDEQGEPEITYKISLITSAGRLLVLLVDAASGEVVGLGGRGIGLGQE